MMMTQADIAALVGKVQAGTYTIEDALGEIAAAAHGNDVRAALYALAYTLNKEGRAGSIDLTARNNINLANSRIDNLIAAETTPALVSDTLWEGSIAVAGDTAALLHSISDYDYLDIYYAFWGVTEIRTVSPAALENNNYCLLRSFNLPDTVGTDGSISGISLAEISLKITGQDVTIDHATVTSWSGSASSNTAAYASDGDYDSHSAGYVYKIVGRKSGTMQSSDSELTDLRVGADGTIYETAGAALRGQLEALGEKITGLPTVEEIASLSSMDSSYLLEYSYPTYTQAALNADGTLNASGLGYVTDKLPVVPGETLWLNGNACNKVAYYDSSGAFLSDVSIATGLNSYIVPSGAAYAIYQVSLSGGTARPLAIRTLDKPENKTFADLILSPLKTNLSIGITGDSNTYGYGLSDTSLSWANLFANELSQISQMRYSHDSPWVEALGAHGYSVGYNFKPGSQMTIWTDAGELSLSIDTNYSSAWEWYVDDVLQIGQDSMATIVLDGTLHKITVKFTSGQAVNPHFELSKTISFENVAVSGVSTSNVTIPEDKDWLLIMIGTNNRTAIPYAISNKFWAYAGKGTYIVPFPNHKTDVSYAVSQMQLYATIKEIFRCHGYETIDCSDVNAYAFYDDALYQSDLIHFNAAGHRVICNMVSGKMELPAMLKSE